MVNRVSEPNDRRGTCRFRNLHTIKIQLLPFQNKFSKALLSRSKSAWLYVFKYTLENCLRLK